MPVALSRDQFIILASLAALTGLAWAYLATLPGTMPEMASMPGVVMAPAAPSFAATAAMWAVMMAGMMLPSILPMVLLFAAVQRRRGAQTILATGTFVSGYLLVWTGFAMLAAGLQIALQHLALLSDMLSFASVRVTGLVFVAAALYEFTPLKLTCLAQCNSPVGFITAHWRPGISGAFRMGVGHGTFCLGCCWAMMLLLFAAGVMNLIWVAVLAGIVLAQKLLPRAALSTAATGGAMLVAGLVLLVT